MSQQTEQAFAHVIGIFVVFALVVLAFRFLVEMLPLLARSLAARFRSGRRSSEPVLPAVPAAASAVQSVSRAELDYRAVALLVTSGERAAWAVIRRCAPQWVAAVCPKVRIEDVIEAQGLDRERRWRLRGYVKSRHVDFVVVDNQWMPRLVVEVDGGSHSRPDRQRRDELVDGALKSAGVPVVRLRYGEDWALRLKERFATLSAAALDSSASES